MWKGIHKLTQIEFTNAILACQNDDMLSETGLLCLKIQEAFKKKHFSLIFCITQKFFPSFLFLLFKILIVYLFRT